MHGWEVASAASTDSIATDYADPVALITVGQPRTVSHPSIVDSYARLKSSLTSASMLTGGIHHFLWLTQAPPPPRILRQQRRRAGVLSSAEQEALRWSQPLDVNSPLWLQSLVIYQPTILVLSNATLPCRHECRLRCDTIRHDAPIEWMRQFFAISNAWSAVLRYEREQMGGKPHRWYVRLRPDLLHLQPLLPLSSLDRAFVHVPSGIMTSARRYQRLNDHIVLCATRELCAPYFRLVERTYAHCGKEFKMPWPPQLLYARDYAAMAGSGSSSSSSSRSRSGSRVAAAEPGVLRLFQHAYTVSRPGSGPECNRLVCNRSDPFATGCVAKHLPAAAPLCEELARGWLARSSEQTRSAMV